MKEGFFIIRWKNISFIYEKAISHLLMHRQKKSVLLPSSSVFRKGKEDKEDKGAREKYFRSSIQRTRERTERDRIEISFSTIYTTLLVEKIKYTNCSFFTEYYKAARILSSRRRE